MKTADVNNLIRDEIRKSLRSGPRPDFDTIAKAVVAQIPDADIPDILLLLVRKQVQMVAHVGRQNTIVATAMSTPTPCLAPAKMTLPKAGTPRWARSVPRWQKLLDSLVNIDGRGSAPKRLGSCTILELTEVVNARFKLGAEVKAEGERYEKLIEAMTVEGAKTPDDLSEATLERFVQGWPT